MPSPFLPKSDFDKRVKNIKNVYEINFIISNEQEQLLNKLHLLAESKE